MSSTLIPRNTLLAACIAKSAHEADVDAGKPTVAQEAIATADSYLNNAVLPTYSELLAALRSIGTLASCAPNDDAKVAGQEFTKIMRKAHDLTRRHDKTLSGNFGA